MWRHSLVIIFCFMSGRLLGQQATVETTEVDKGWASNSVNSVIFRKNSLVTYKGVQYIAYYNSQQFVVLGKRRSGEGKWELVQTKYKGNAADAHNCISIMVDGKGYLHMSWDHHGNNLNYCRSKEPGSLELTDKLSMTGKNEDRVTYPEFHKLPNGNLLFFFRNGSSGRGNLVLNRYNIKTQKWSQLHANLIDGQEHRNAYWQACVDAKGTVHLSWVWRESPDVASNHDMCYARSSNGGRTWSTSTGKKYKLPITATTAEYACLISQKSELINQTSMFADPAGNPYIATYWREKDDPVPQYRLIYKKGRHWTVSSMDFRKTAFTLSGAGTKRIPISRPQIIAWKQDKTLNVVIIFRDAERGNKVSAAITTNFDNWKIIDLSEEAVGSWEPTYDTELWRDKGILNLFVQRTEQADAEGRSNMPPQMIKVLEWRPK